MVKTLDDLSASKLHPAEQQTVRDAADALFFCEDLGGDSEAERALAALDELADRLASSQRLLPETADRLRADVQACGPLAPVA